MGGLVRARECVWLGLATVACLQCSELLSPYDSVQVCLHPFCWVFNPKTCVFQFGKYIELLLKNDVFPFSLCFLFGVLEFSFGYWSSRTYPPIDITFFGFHSILQNENLSSTISSSSSICFHCSYTFLFPGDLLLLLLSEFLVTSYLWVRNVIFSPNSEYFVDFFKFQCHTYLMFTPNMFICLSFVSYLSFFLMSFKLEVLCKYVHLDCLISKSKNLIQSTVCVEISRVLQRRPDLTIWQRRPCVSICRIFSLVYQFFGRGILESSTERWEWSWAGSL